MSLVSLELCNCAIDSHNASLLFWHLKNNNTLVNLNLGNPHSNQRNRIGVQGARALADLLKTNKFLSVLSLQACGITEEMLGILNQAFRVNKTLLHLDLSHNDLNDITGTSLVVCYSL